jgi:hypothetical protein
MHSTSLYCLLILIIVHLVAHILLAQVVQQDFQHSVGTETAYLEVHPAVGKAYPVVAIQLGLEEGSPYPLVVEKACLVEAKVDVQEDSQDEVEDPRSYRREVVA